MRVFVCAGPAPLEALAAGCVVLQGRFKTPLNSENTVRLPFSQCPESDSRSRIFSREIVRCRHVDVCPTRLANFWLCKLGFRQIISRLLLFSLPGGLSLSNVSRVFWFNIAKTGGCWKINAAGRSTSMTLQVAVSF